jgi:hypothetical protein
MTHPNARKGTRAELAVAKFLNHNGHPKAERARSGWTDDRGDIDGIDDLTVEVKDQRRHDIGSWLKELENLKQLICFFCVLMEQILVFLLLFAFVNYC